MNPQPEPRAVERAIAAYNDYAADGGPIQRAAALGAALEVYHAVLFELEGQAAEAAPATFTTELNLEESGTLCHLLLRSIMESQETAPREYLGRMSELYARLAEGNDQLMGKRS